MSSLSWLIDLRWLAGVGVLGGTWFSANMMGLHIPTIHLYVLGLGVLAYNALLLWATGRLATQPAFAHGVYQWFARLQVGLDWLAMTLLIHLSGGIESPTIIYFLFRRCCCRMTRAFCTLLWLRCWWVEWLF